MKTRNLSSERSSSGGKVLTAANRVRRDGIEIVFAEISSAIESKFLKRVALSEKNGATYFWKWVSTRDVANYLEWSLSKTRYWLNRIEAAGEIHSKRSPNWCCWAQNYIHGFKQHQFTDYYERA